MNKWMPIIYRNIHSLPRGYCLIRRTAAAAVVSKALQHSADTASVASRQILDRMHIVMVLSQNCDPFPAPDPWSARPNSSLYLARCLHSCTKAQVYHLIGEQGFNPMINDRAVGTQVSKAQLLQTTIAAAAAATQTARVAREAQLLS